MLQDIMTRINAHQTTDKSLNEKWKSIAPIGPMKRREIEAYILRHNNISVNKPALRFGLRLSCIHRNQLAEKGSYI